MVFRSLWVLLLIVAFHCSAYAASPLPTNPSESTPNVIVVRPAGWESALREWVRFRSESYRILEIDSQQDPYALREEIRNAAVRGQKTLPAAIVLCGDVYDVAINEQRVSGKTPLVPRVLTPTFVLATSVRLGQVTSDRLSTDVLYGDADDDGCPDIAVGRLPAKNPRELERMLARSIAYEQSTDVGDWRDNVHVTAGVGGFGVLADSAIEAVARRYLAEGIPDRFRLQMTYASLSSPYCPDPRLLKSTYIDKINQGGLFWVYIGHGWIDRLDQFKYGSTEEQICGTQDIARFDAPSGPPIAVLLACYTGAMDATVDCFAERLLQQPNGPIAVLAGSRVTMPYGLSQLAGEMMEACFEDGIPTLGQTMLQAKRSIWQQEEVKEKSGKESKLRTKYRLAIEQMAISLSPPNHSLLEERREHVRLMNLFGDPLLKVRQPKQIELNGEDSVLAGETLKISGKAPWSGKMDVEWGLHRDRLPEGLVSVGSYRGDEEQHAQMQANYERANQLVLWRESSDVKSGDFELTIPIPSDHRGKYVLRVRMQTDEEWAMGSKRVQVKRVRSALSE